MSSTAQPKSNTTHHHKQTLLTGIPNSLPFIQPLLAHHLPHTSFLLKLHGKISTGHTAWKGTFGGTALSYQCDLRECLPSMSCVVKWKCKSMAMEQGQAN